MDLVVVDEFPTVLLKGVKVVGEFPIVIGEVINTFPMVLGKVINAFPMVLDEVIDLLVVSSDLNIDGKLASNEPGESFGVLYDVYRN